MGGPTFTHLLKRQRRRCSLQPVLQIHLLLFHEPLEQCGPHPAMRNPHRWHRRFAGSLCAYVSRRTTAQPCPAAYSFAYCTIRLPYLWPANRGGTHSVCTTSTSSPSPGYCHATSSYSAGWAFQYHAGTDLTILFQHDHLPLRARRASVQRSSGIRPIPNGNRLHAPARKSAGPRRSRRSPRYPQMLPVVSCYFFLFEPR